LLDALGLRGRPFVLAVASANPTKNLPSLAAAFAPIGAEGSVRLVLVGRQRPGVFAAGGSAPGMPGVIHAGAVSDAQLKALYRHAVALVVPSRYEGFGLPPLEAMAEGCPVIAARAGALPEVCGDAPQWVPVDDVAALEQALRLLLNDPALRAARARAGREHVAAWSWRAAAGRLIELMGGAA
jgi:glycosyltransferase involved in cell wall biosynthesis